jgi:hypothetical protein
MALILLYNVFKGASPFDIVLKNPCQHLSCALIACLSSDLILFIDYVFLKKFTTL